jgi:phage baseplate assembly protein W
MADLAHGFGADLTIGPTGDLAVSDGAALTRERVLRRLLTNPGDYLWQLDYGAGLAQFVGQPASAARIRAVVRGQIFKEAAVARSPEPVVQARDDNAGGLAVQLRYGDAAGGQPQLLTFSVGGA